MICTACETTASCAAGPRQWSRNRTVNHRRKSCRISRQAGIRLRLYWDRNNVSIRKATIGRHQRSCAAALQPGTIAGASPFRKWQYRTSERCGRTTKASSSHAEAQATRDHPALSIPVDRIVNTRALGERAGSNLAGRAACRKRQRIRSVA
jgi:hypothetical protein